MVQFPNPIVDELTVNSAGNPFTYVRIYDNGGLSLPIIEFASSIGRTFKLVSLHQRDLAIFADNLTTNVVQYFVQDEGIAFLSTPVGAGNTGVLIDVADSWLKWGSYTPEPGFAFAPETWHTFTLQNSWTTVGVTAFMDPAYMKDPTGRVWIRGVAANGTTANGTTVCTLPSGYIPAERKQFPLTLNAGTALTAVCQIMETGSGTDGQVKIYGVPAGNAIGFDEISFSLQ